MKQKYVKRTLKKALKLFLEGRYEDSMSLLENFEETTLSQKSKWRLRCVLDVMLIGELFGLHTLKSILDVFQIKSNNLYKIWKAHTFHQIKRLSLEWSVAFFENSLKELLEKSASSWSRASVTIIIDDSIFKQWLKNMPRGHTYDKFFSGQTGRTQYGFRVQLIGVAIGDDFYPLYFQVVKKKDCSQKTALKLLKKVHGIFTKICNKHQLTYPNLGLSVDSSFTNKDLIAYCTKHNIEFIGGTKRNNVFTINNIKSNLKEYIDKEYNKKKQAHEEKYKAQGKEVPPFRLRLRAYFHWLKKEVVLLFFQLKGSKKVTVIFCSKLTIMAKTFRRRFFQRTKIELFFRFLKHTLQIQKSKSERYGDFMKKLSLFILKAMICLQFEKFCRKKFKVFRGWSFTKLRHHLIYQDIEKTALRTKLRI